MTLMKTSTVLMAATILTGCGWFRTDLPIRTGPQSEPHVTYAAPQATAKRTAPAGGISQQTEARFRAICGAGNFDAGVRAARSTGIFNPPAIANIGKSGGRTALFEDGRRDAVLITSAPAGDQCFYTDGVQTWTWNPDGRVTVEAARS